MSGHRKKPFSNKAKKAQLSAKRLVKKDKAQNEVSGRHAGGPTEQPISAIDSGPYEDVKEVRTRLEVLRVHDQPRFGRHDPNRYRLHFAKESDVEIDRRKVASRQPLELLPQEASEVAFESVHHDNRVPDFPLRPKWDYSMSREELEANEQKEFQKWVDDILDKYGDEVSYFEINLETWRQLWRVLEISDIVMLLTDIRHPMIHFPPALYKYIVHDCKREMILVLNKIDLVTPTTVKAWIDYFKEKFPQLRIASFTSFPNEKISDVEEVFKKKRGHVRRSRLMAWGQDQILLACESCNVTKHGQKVDFNDWRNKVKIANQNQQLLIEKERLDEANEMKYDGGPVLDSDDDDDDVDGLEHAELDDTEVGPHKDYVTIGVVGYPNVGKSSLLNGLVGTKVVSCSRTPGHTKHFQTIFLTPNIRLCDSPGLVFPSMVAKQLQ
eukprot:Ihof_evm3s331 gene=Ihof_evmTU3s331